MKLKRGILILLAAVMVVCLAGCTGKPQEDPNHIKIGKYEAMYTGSELVVDSEGNNTIVVHLDYTNKSNEESSFEWSFFYNVLQGDQELEYSTIYVNEDTYDTLDAANMTMVAPGKTQSVCMTYKLNDLATPVVINFTDILESEKDVLTVDITHLKKGSSESQNDETTTKAAEQSGAEGGEYVLIGMIANGQEYDYEMVKMSGMTDNTFINMNADGTGTLSLVGQSYIMTYTDSVIKAANMDMPYTVEGDKLTLDMTGVQYIFQPKGAELPTTTTTTVAETEPESETETEPETEPKTETETETTTTAAAEDPTEPVDVPAGNGDLSVTGSAEVVEFMTDIPTKVNYAVPGSGWVVDDESESTLYLYNVPSEDKVHSAAPRIQFTTKQDEASLNFYYDNFKNVVELDTRTIGGIEMAGRSYKNVGMEWIEYYGTLENGMIISIKISEVSVDAGTEGAAILDYVTFE